MTETQSITDIFDDKRDSNELKGNHTAFKESLQIKNKTFEENQNLTFVNSTNFNNKNDSDAERNDFIESLTKHSHYFYTQTTSI